MLHIKGNILHKGITMDFNSMYREENVDFGKIQSRPFLIGLLSAFDNRFQAVADSFFEEINHTILQGQFSFFNQKAHSHTCDTFAQRITDMPHT